MPKPDIPGALRTMVQRRIMERDRSRAPEMAASAREKAASAPTLRERKRLLEDAERLEEDHRRKERRVSGLGAEIGMLDHAMCATNAFRLGAMVSSMCAAAPTPAFVSSDKCECGTVMFAKLDNCEFVCGGCGRTAPNCSRAIEGLCDANPDRIISAAAPETERKRGGPADLYRDYIEQFSDDVPPTNPEILNTIRTRLFKTRHMETSDLVRITVLVNELRQSGFPEYIKSAPRIEMEITGKEVPRVPRALVERLCERFRIIDGLYRDSEAKGKSINHRAVTKISLLCEGRPDLARLFEEHKTMDVIETERRILMRCFARAANVAPQLRWAWPY